MTNNKGPHWSIFIATTPRTCEVDLSFKGKFAILDGFVYGGLLLLGGGGLVLKWKNNNNDNDNNNKIGCKRFPNHIIQRIVFGGMGIMLGGMNLLLLRQSKNKNWLKFTYFSGDLDPPWTTKAQEFPLLRRSLIITTSDMCVYGGLFGLILATKRWWWKTGYTFRRQPAIKKVILGSIGLAIVGAGIDIYERVEVHVLKVPRAFFYDEN